MGAFGATPRFPKGGKGRGSRAKYGPVRRRQRRRSEHGQPLEQGYVLAWPGSVKEQGMRRKANLARIVAVPLALVLLLGSDPAAAQQERPDPPQVRATAWVLVDADTGLYLAGKNPDRRLPVASTTKIMVALAALQEGANLE